MIKRIFLCATVVLLILSMACSCDSNSEDNESNDYPSYTVTLVCPNDKTVDGKAVSVVWSNVYKLPVPKKENYTFKGWQFGDDVLASTGVWSYSQDATLTAIWEPKSYPITYLMYPHYGEALQAYNVETEGFAIRHPSKVAGQMFLGWTGEGIDEPTKYVYIPQGSFGAKTYTAHWVAVEDIENQLDGFVFDIVDDHAVVVGYCGEAEAELMIPTEYAGYPVTTIGNSAFYGLGVFTGKIKIPNTISIIEDNAFGECKGLPITIVDVNGQDIDDAEVQAWHQNAIIGSNNGGLTK